MTLNLQCLHIVYNAITPDSHGYCILGTSHYVDKLGGNNE